MKALRKYSLLLVVLGGTNCVAAEDEYYRAFLSVVDTNKNSNGNAIAKSSLADPTNTGEKLTNTVVRVDQFKAVGEVGDIRLGMTMGEVVARLGKPSSLTCSRLYGACFYYKNAELYFEGNALSLITNYGSLPFDHDLVAKSGSDGSRINNWIRVLGEPKERIESNWLVYENAVAILRLGFGRDGHHLGGFVLYSPGYRFARNLNRKRWRGTWFN